MVMVFGSGFRVGWLIQFSCICISAFLVFRSCMATQNTLTVDADQLYTLTKHLKVKIQRHAQGMAVVS